MATEVIMPQMGESIAEGTITKWLVQVGERVEKDQPLFEISTDKVDAEIPSPAAGTLLVIHHGEGATVQVNELVALVGEPTEKADSELAAEKPVAESVVEEAAMPMEVVVAEPPPPAPDVAPSSPSPNNKITGEQHIFSDNGGKIQ